MDVVETVAGNLTVSVGDLTKTDAVLEQRISELETAVTGMLNIC